MESAGVNSTVCGKRFASLFAASGGPGCAGSRTNTKSGAASGADFDNAGASSMCTRTAAFEFAALADAFEADADDDAADPDAAAAGHRGSGATVRLGRHSLREPVDLLLQDRADRFGRIHAQQLLEARLTEREVATADRGSGAEEERLTGVWIEGERLLDEAPGAAIELRLIGHRERFGFADERLRVLTSREPVRALERAQGERKLLQHDVGASEHQPAIHILRIALEFAREARHHRLR